MKKEKGFEDVHKKIHSGLDILGGSEESGVFKIKMPMKSSQKVQAIGDLRDSLKKMPKEEQLKIINGDPQSIYHLTNPDKELWIAAIRGGLVYEGKTLLPADLKEFCIKEHFKGLPYVTGVTIDEIFDALIETKKEVEAVRKELGYNDFGKLIRLYVEEEIQPKTTDEDTRRLFTILLGLQKPELFTSLRFKEVSYLHLLPGITSRDYQPTRAEFSNILKAKDLPFIYYKAWAFNPLGMDKSRTRVQIEDRMAALSKVINRDNSLLKLVTRKRDIIELEEIYLQLEKKELPSLRPLGLNFYSNKGILWLREFYRDNKIKTPMQLIRESVRRGLDTTTVKTLNTSSTEDLVI